MSVSQQMQSMLIIIRTRRNIHPMSRKASLHMDHIDYRSGHSTNSRSSFFNLTPEKEETKTTRLNINFAERINRFTSIGLKVIMCRLDFFFDCLYI